METKNIAILTVTLLTLRAGFQSAKARNTFLELVKNKRWLMNLLIIIAFIVYISYSVQNNKSKESKRTAEALKKAIIALLIAILAELGLTIAPFWLIFVLAYYMEGWI